MGGSKFKRSKPENALQTRRITPDEYAELDGYVMTDEDTENMTTNEGDTPSQLAPELIQVIADGGKLEWFAFDAAPDGRDYDAVTTGYAAKLTWSSGRYRFFVALQPKVVLDDLINAVINLGEPKR